ncbi:MAG: sodium/solute symporter [Planctomycetia bacterium]|nr:sodium/solute symporter [Planctomycetia bacterium]
MNFLIATAQASGFAFATWDAAVFVAFIVAVILISTMKSRSAGDSSQDYFLAGRGLSWWLIGFSLIAANISAEQFVGMAGNAAQCTGLAIASFEWIAAITLVGVAFIFLPMFLRCGIYTVPEFLEYRYNKTARSLMSFLMMIILVGVSIAAVIYLGALTVDTLFRGTSVLGIPINVVTASWCLGALATLYVFIGGLKACAWADLLQGSALILGGFVVMIFAFGQFDKVQPQECGVTPQYLRPVQYQKDADSIDMFSDVKEDSHVVEKFMIVNADKLHMLRPLNDPNIVWTTLFFGIWIPNFYYWGLNQYIMQRTLGSRSLAEGQKGIVFAAGMKLLIPFIVVVPGIIAFNLYHDQMKSEAQSDEMANRPVSALFDRLVAGTPQEGDKTNSIFQFNQEYSVLYPEKAKEIFDYNVKKTNVSNPEGLLAESRKKIEEANQKAGVTMDESLVSALALQGANKALIKEKKGEKEGEKGALDIFAPAKYSVEKELVGYKYDAAFPLLLRNLPFPVGVSGFVLAALFGAIMSSLASMLNAASTIFTMDIYNEYINKNASQKKQVFIGRVCVVLFAIIACLIVPFLADPRFGGLFKYIQEFQGYLSPGVLVVFLYGLVSKRVPGFAGVVAIVLSPIVYGATKFISFGGINEMNYLNQMALTFGVLWIIMMIINFACPLAEEKQLPKGGDMDMTPSKGAAICGIFVVILTLVLYAYFW